MLVRSVPAKGVGSCGNGVTGFGQIVRRGCGQRVVGSCDRVIGMKGTGKGCGSSGDGGKRCGQRG